ncbi:MAG: type IX secretion system outer membrane channel protein PorV [Bacteroidota bacterium]|nr:type IX secretion system outer membrane channel protein PorV [Bacteroidota bacterium]
MFFLIGGKIYAQNQQEINAITTAVPFLLIAPDSRAGGMGDAGVAASPDGNSIHWNPSKLAFIEDDMGFSLSYIPWLRSLVPDINISYLSGYKRIDKEQTIAASLFYSSLGNIQFTNMNGDPIGDYRPNEFAFDVAYARKLSPYFSGGIAVRYIYSNLTMGQNVGGADTRAGMAAAADVSGYYVNPDIKLGNVPATIAVGANLSNVGNKMAYSGTGRRDFIPINLRIGPALTLKPDEFNSITFVFDAMKLMVPTPPLYNNNREILAGRDPDVGVAAGMFGSFNDAPGMPMTDESGRYIFNDDGTAQIEKGSVFKEEMREINMSLGMEYWYDKQFALRVGYFHEHSTKGNRKFVTFGAGLKYNVFGLDLAYIVPTVQRHPLANTLRFTLTMNFAAVKQGGNTPN